MKRVVKSPRELQLTVLRLFPGILVPGTTWKRQRNVVENRCVLFNWWQASNFSLQYHCFVKHTGYENKLNDQHRWNVLSSDLLEFSTSGKNRFSFQVQRILNAIFKSEKSRGILFLSRHKICKGVFLFGKVMSFTDSVPLKFHFSFFFFPANHEWPCRRGRLVWVIWRGSPRRLLSFGCHGNERHQRQASVWLLAASGTISI